MTTQPLPPFHEPYPPDLARQFGAVKGMKYRYKKVEMPNEMWHTWEDTEINRENLKHDWLLNDYDFTVPLGTVAALTTPLPEGKCDCGTDKLTVGTRIRFTKELREPADGDHPEFIYCREGDEGEIVKIDCGKPYAFCAKWDHWKSASFYLNRGDFEPVHSPSCSIHRPYIHILPVEVNKHPEWRDQILCTNMNHVEWQPLGTWPVPMISAFAYAVPAPLEENKQCPECGQAPNNPRSFCNNEVFHARPVQWDKSVSMADAKLGPECFGGEDFPSAFVPVTDYPGVSLGKVSVDLATGEVCPAQADPPPIATGKDFFNEWCGESYKWAYLPAVERERWNRFAKAILKRYAK